MWLEGSFNEDNLQSILINNLLLSGWVKETEYTRCVYPAKFSKPTIASGIIANETSTLTITLPSDRASRDDYVVYGDGITTSVNYDVEEMENGTTKLIFDGALQPSTPKKIQVFYCSLKETDYIEFHFARHSIMKNSYGQIFGIARHGIVKNMIKDIPREVPTAFIPQTSHAVTWGSNLEMESEAMTWAYWEVYGLNGSDQKWDNSSLYFYQLDKYEEPLDNLYNHTVGWENESELKRVALDAEIYTTMWELNDNSTVSFKITQINQDNGQSPVAESIFRLPALETEEIIAGIVVKQTNWWGDSKIKVTGIIDDKMAFLIFKADSAPQWIGNSVPITPVYMGAFDSLGPYARSLNIDAALFVGRTPPGNNTEQTGDYDYDNVDLTSSIIFPIMKSYPDFASNGVDSIMVKRTKYGAKYQAHYISVDMPPSEMPPDRISEEGQKHSRAWFNKDNIDYSYQFNPSNYSDAVQSSKIYIVHPEDGVFGSLSNIIATSPLSLMDGDYLIDVVDNCLPVEVKYTYYLTEALSPLTKRPATQFRPLGIGIKTQ